MNRGQGLKQFCLVAQVHSTDVQRGWLGEGVGHLERGAEDRHQAHAEEARARGGNRGALQLRWPHHRRWACKRHHPAVGCQRWVLARSCKDLRPSTFSLRSIPACDTTCATPTVSVSCSLVRNVPVQVALVVQGLYSDKMRCMCARAGKFGSSAAVGQVLPPKPQMLGKQDWRYVSGGGQYVHGAHAAECDITSLAFLRDSHTMLSRGADATLKACAHPPCQGY